MWRCVVLLLPDVDVGRYPVFVELWWRKRPACDLKQTQPGRSRHFEQARRLRHFFAVHFARCDEDTSVTQFDLCHEDCLYGMATLPNEHVDLVVTSPPYNLGVRYGKYSDRQDRQSYLRWCSEWAAEIRRVLKPPGSFFLNIGGVPSNPMLPHEIAMELRDKFALQNTIHWIKSITIEDRQSALHSHGHFKPISSRRFLNDCHEYVFHFTISGQVEIDRLALGVPYQDKSNIARWAHTAGADLRCRGNTWFIPYETIQSRTKERPHPATFPVQLAERCIKLHGVSRVRTMLDPFLGIGNSAVAAQRCGVRKFIGFEIDESYLTEAKRRLSNNQTRKACHPERSEGPLTG